MIEYRLESMPQPLADILTDAEAFVAEENFEGKTTYLVYANDDISDILAMFHVKFTSINTSDTGWDEKWKDFIKEDWLTPSLYFIFEHKTFSDGRKTILINPSLAFGTGTHPTTQIAARLLEPVVSGHTILDIGTGSGILAIAASKLGAKGADAFDNDPQALTNCLENIKNNGCININAWTGELSEMEDSKRFDVVCANIISSVLLLLNDDVYQHANKYIVYSGILKVEYPETIKSLIKVGWKEDAYLEMNEWCGVRIKKEGV